MKTKTIKIIDCNKSFDVQLFKEYIKDDKGKSKQRECIDFNTPPKYIFTSNYPFDSNEA